MDEGKQAELTFGTTILNALDMLGGKGFQGSFRVKSPHEVQCLRCRRTNHAKDVHLEHLVRVEGVSDPDDEEAVLGLECPDCNLQGVLILTFGVNAPPEHGEILARLQDERG